MEEIRRIAVFVFDFNGGTKKELQIYTCIVDEIRFGFCEKSCPQSNKNLRPSLPFSATKAPVIRRRTNERFARLIALFCTIEVRPSLICRAKHFFLFERGYKNGQSHSCLIAYSGQTRTYGSRLQHAKLIRHSRIFYSGKCTVD